MTSMEKDAISLWFELLKFLGQALVVIAGWWVVNWLTAKRELSKARRDAVAKEVDSLFDSINRLIADAMKYHAAFERDVANEVGIKMALQDLSHHVSGLGRVVNDKASVNHCSEKFIDFKRACTAEHFEDEHDGPREHESPIIEKIANSGLVLKNELMSVKLDQFLSASDRRCTSRS